MLFFTILILKSKPFKMNYRKATLKDLDSLSKLFDAYRMFYHKSTDLEGAKTFYRGLKLDIGTIASFEIGN